MLVPAASSVNIRTKVDSLYIYRFSLWPVRRPNQRHLARIIVQFGVISHRPWHKLGLISRCSNAIFDDISSQLEALLALYQGG